MSQPSEIALLTSIDARLKALQAAPNPYFKFVTEKGWTWQQVIIEDLVVNPGASVNLFVDNNIVGYLYAIDLLVNNPSLRFVGAAYAGGPIVESYDFNELLAIGETGGTLLKLLKYDDPNQTYYAEYNPNVFPGEPFRGNLSFKAINPLPLPITIGYFELDIMKLNQDYVASLTAAAAEAKK